MTCHMPCYGCGDVFHVPLTRADDSIARRIVGIPQPEPLCRYCVMRLLSSGRPLGDRAARDHVRELSTRDGGW